MSRTAKALVWLLAMAVGGYLIVTRLNINPTHSVGDPLDEFNGVPVFYNGAINATAGRRVTADGYNLGLKFQCVEFVKRYYFERFGHKMPNAMGNAKDFFAEAVKDGEMNKERMLVQYRNGGRSGPEPDDLIVFAPWVLNRYGHVAIVSEVGPDFIEVVQQNPGPFGSTRERFPLVMHQGRLRVGHDRVLGWLRRELPAHPKEWTAASELHATRTTRRVQPQRGLCGPAPSTPC